MQRPEPGKPRNQLSKGSPVNTNDNQSHEVRQGWREDGRVDIDVVRAGTHDVNDSAAVFESLCDEVEQLRAEREPKEDDTAKLARYLRQFADEVESGRVPIGEIPHASLYYSIEADQFGGNDGALAEVERIAAELGGKVTHKPYQNTVQHSAYVVWGSKYETRVEYNATYHEHVTGGES